MDSIISSRIWKGILMGIKLVIEEPRRVPRSYSWNPRKEIFWLLSKSPIGHRESRELLYSQVFRYCFFQVDVCPSALGHVFPSRVAPCPTAMLLSIMSPVLSSKRFYKHHVGAWTSCKGNISAIFCHHMAKVSLKKLVWFQRLSWTWIPHQIYFSNPDFSVK